MEIYLYGTYEHSRNGYTLMRVEDHKLRPVAAGEDTPALGLVREFFFHDEFRMIWKDSCLSSQREGICLKPELSVAVIRGLEGSISGRHGSVDLAVTGGAEEEDFIRKMILCFLGDYEFHERKLFFALSIGRGGALEADAQRLSESLTERSGEEDYKKIEAYKGGRLWEKLIRPRNAALTQRSLFRFAVCRTDWTETALKLAPAWLWKRAPAGVISNEVFEKLCLKK